MGENSRTIYLLSRLHYALKPCMDRALKDAKLSAVQYTVLSILQGRERLSSAEIARRYCVKPQSMNEVIFALEKRKLISREEDSENRRILRVTLTPAGRELVERCDRMVDELEEKMFAGSTAADIKSVRRVLSGALSEIRNMEALAKVAVNGD